ncbi:ABC transporter ATP-binding protein [Rubritalea spongiae]|uniref:ABC transporter ATP-binding protein n=1 Tax=Rubritalea spongiae TaxID=430797 RepID=A0ABW5E1Q6_9BACT
MQSTDRSKLLLECVDVGYSVGKAKTLLQGVSFLVNEGEHCAVVGPNGAGKTTLLNLLLGLNELSAGDVLYRGNSIKGKTQRELAKLVAYVPQLLATEIPYSVLEFVAMGRYAHGGGEDDDAVVRAMEMVDVVQFKDRAVASLSGGERQRVCIAAALAQEAPLLVLDEPLSHLDPGQRLEIRRVIRQLPKNITIIAVTHDMDWLLEDFNRVLCITGGALKYDVDVEGFVQQELAEELFGHGLGGLVEKRYGEVKT